MLTSHTCGVFGKILICNQAADCATLLCVLGFKSKDGVPQMVKAYLDKKVMLDEFITHNMKLEQVNDAVELMKHGKWWVHIAR